MEANDDAWDAQMAVNAKGVFLCTQVRQDNEATGKREDIVNASGAGRTSPGKVPLGIYAAASMQRSV
ncbi:hypothetical protein CM1200mP19_1610 [bacterium]|nr:MAG: hypothetical protein CM1200mP19_1610 [bacterium]